MTKSQKQKAFNLKKKYFPSFLMKQLSWEGQSPTLNRSYESIYENRRKWGKLIQDDKSLAEELQKYPCLYEK